MQTNNIMTISNSVRCKVYRFVYKIDGYNSRVARPSYAGVYTKINNNIYSRSGVKLDVSFYELDLDKRFNIHYAPVSPYAGVAAIPENHYLFNADAVMLRGYEVSEKNVSTSNALYNILQDIFSQLN